MQTSPQVTTQLLNLLILLQTKETLEDYKEFCYQLYYPDKSSQFLGYYSENKKM